jgi:DNA-directed RNA polymerase subunit omega
MSFEFLAGDTLQKARRRIPQIFSMCMQPSRQFEPLYLLFYQKIDFHVTDSMYLYKKVSNRYTFGMIFPLEELIEYDDNMYEITTAASRRAYQLAMLKDPEIEANDGKTVSLAARQLFTKRIEFRLED